MASWRTTGTLLLLVAALVAALIAWERMRGRARPASPPPSRRIPDASYLLSFTLQGGDGSAEIRFDIESKDDFHLLVLRGPAWEFHLCAPEGDWCLAQGPLKPNPGPSPLRILRRRDRIAVTRDEEFLFALNGLGLGSVRPPETRVSGDCSLSTPRLQPLGHIYFSDDFMREGENGVWQPLSGCWELHSTSFVETSSNPFCLFARGPLTPSKEDAPPERGGAEFVGVGIQVAPARPFPQVVRITGNSPAALAGIGIGDSIQAVNGQDLTDLPVPRVYEMLRGGEGSEVELTLQRPGHPQPRTVRLRRERLRWGEIERQFSLEPSRVEETALVSAGEFFWDRYHFEAAVRPRVRGAVGLAAHVRDPSHYLLLRWWGDDPAGQRSHRLEIVRVNGTEETVLAESPGLGGPLPFNTYRMGIQVEAEEIIGRIDGIERVRARRDDLSFGRVGLYARASDGVTFDDVLVSSDPVDPGRRKARSLPSEIREDPIMSEWADDQSAWIPQLTTGMRWLRDDFPSDVRLILQEIPNRAFRLILAGDGTLPVRGYVLLIDRPAGRVHLYRHEVRMASAALPAGSAAIPLAFSRLSSRLEVVAGEETLISWDDPIRLLQTKVGVQLTQTRGVRVENPALLDYTFTSAAVDWEIAGGAWGMMNRWICDPRWSWFGGMSRGIVAAWNKHEVRGDLRVDVTVAFMMFREQRPIERPGDLGVTFYGDGKSLFSGYTFLVGGEQNSWTRLYRNGEVVASTSEASFLLPEDRGDEDSLDAIHRHWFHLQVRRRGNLVTGLYQGVPALQFEDPEPIESGRIAIWSVNNGILLARVQVLPEHLAGYNVPQRTWTRVDGPPLTNWVDGQIDAALEKQEEGVWTVRNLLSGGHFAVRLLPDHITPGSRARLRFDCKFDPGVRVDLYFQAGRRTLKYGLTGPPKAEAILRPSYLPEAIPLAGRAGEKLDDGQWHTVTLDLSGYSGEAEGLSHFTFANYSNEDYLLAGYSANAVGAAYYVRNISFSEEKP